MPKKSTIKKVSLFFLVCLSLGLIFYLSNETLLKDDLSKQREQHSEFLKNSPFSETLTWDKKKRKQNGLPPNRYFEQMWELTINPSTGKLNDGELTMLREQLIKERKTNGSSSGLTGRNPGNALNAWEERGPNNIGGRTRVIMFDPNDASNNTVYAGGVSGGLWKNTNISSSASTWSRVENVPGNLSVTSITIDPRNSNIWYVGTGEQYTGGDVVGNGVYVTTNGGTTWNALTIPPADSGDINFNATNLFLSGIYYVNDVLAWDNGTSTELFVAVGAHVYGNSSSPKDWLGLQSSGLYRSTNGGATWSRIESTNMQHTFGGLTYYYIPNDLEVGADNKLWMGTISSSLGEGGGRVFSSTNGGTWTEAAASPLTDSNRVELEPSATDASKLYALTGGVTSPVHIYTTSNGFGSISSVSLPNDADTGISANDFCRGQAFYDLVIESDPSNDNIVYVGGIDLFKTTNGGSSWSQLSHWYGGFGYQGVHADQHAIAFGNNSSSQIVFGNDGGIYYSGNSGSTISVRNNGYNVTQFVKAGIGPDGTGDTHGIFSAGAQDNGTQAFRNATVGVNSSEELSDGDGFYTFVDKDGQYIIATYIANVIYRFDLPWNGLGRIDGAATTLSYSLNTGDFVNQMDYDSDANRLLSNNSSGTSYSIRSIDVAANNSGILTSTALTTKPTAFRGSPFATNTWYVGTASGGLLRLTNVTNSSATWATITTPFVGSVSSVRFGATANDLIVTIHNYGVTNVWYSSNAGSSWSSKEGNLPDIPVRDFLLNPLNLNEAILATQLGVWETLDFNATSPTWSQAYNGMSDVSVTSFDYWDVSGDHTTNKVIASTYGRGVFTGSFTGTSIPDTEAPTAPTSLTASNITQISVDLSWTASTDNVGVSGYDIYQDGSLITNVSGTTYQVIGLSASSAYSFTVRAKDAAGNVSAASNVVSITTDTVGITYCASASTNVNDEYISSVQLNTINNSSGAQFYSDFTSLSTTLVKGSQYTITVTPTWTGSTYNEGYSVWIDYNKNGDFTDAGEQVWTQAATSTTPVNGSFTVPAGAIENSTRMRVAMKYNGIPTSCESFQYGEVEDYTIVIQASVPDTTAPTAPTNLVASNVTESGASLSWTASTDNVGVSDYDVYQGTTIIATVIGTTYQVSGLTANTNYDFTVVAKDAAGNVSAASPVVSITTDTVVMTYCASASTNVNDEYIGRVQLNTIDNSSGAQFYSDFTSLSTTLVKGSQYTITITPTWTGTIYNEGYSVWIDYNKNGDFTDSGEQVWTQTATSTTPVSGSFTVPAGAIESSTRMRVAMKYNGIPTSCESFQWGEVEDYTIMLQSSRSVTIVPVITINGITPTRELNTDDGFNSNKDFMLYPNPVSRSILNIRMSGDISINYRILDMLGKRVTGGTTSKEIDVSNLNAGAYFLEVNDGDETMIKRFVKR